jgi:hypothetical protein
MEIDFVKQANETAIKGNHFDFIFCASGYERRASNILRFLSIAQLQKSNKICFEFKDRPVHSRKFNNAEFTKNGFRFIEVSSEDVVHYSEIYHTLFESFRKKEIKILVDYSCMTSILYASFIKYFIDYAEHFNVVNITFSYSVAKFTKPVTRKSLYFNQPIPLFDPIQSTDQKIALIIGLGYEKDKALGLYEYFQNDKQDIYLFITGKSGEPKFFEAVTKNNKTLIDIVNPNNIIYYDLDNNAHLLSTMDSLINYLTNVNYRVVIAPIGPKVFTLSALLINLIHRNITTYRLSDGNKGQPIDKFADEAKGLIVTQLNLINKQPVLEADLKEICS